MMPEAWNQVMMGVVVVCAVTVFLIRLSKRSIHHDLQARDVTKGHHWRYVSVFEQPPHCSICNALMMGGGGAYCDSCGVCADEGKCINQANKELPCKSISCSSGPLKHHWVKGNVPWSSSCAGCNESGETDNYMIDYLCCWCHRASHPLCRNTITPICDLADLKEYVVPPNYIKLRSSRIKRGLVISKVIHPNVENWRPVVVIGNRLSGSNKGEAVLSEFRRVLNPSQIVDLADKTPEEALDWCRLLPDVTCCVLVAGGDGTIGWVLNTIHKLKLKNPPPVGVLPLGTGNDLSQVLGWGDNYSEKVDPFKYLHLLSKAKVAAIDRWKVHYKPSRSLAGLHMPSREIFMNNYLSIGVDALVTLNFHLARQSPFYICSNRILNKFIYFTFGTKDVIEHECKDLQESIVIKMDGEIKELPQLESVVVLNIECWGGGCKPWKLGSGGPTAPNQDFSDGLLEVFCLTSSFHIAQLQMGLSEPIRLGQCSSLEVHLKSTAPMQVDGEPWQQHPGVVSVTHSHRAAMLLKE